MGYVKYCLLTSDRSQATTISVYGAAIDLDSLFFGIRDITELTSTESISMR